MILRNRNAIITGANQGLGAHIARLFMREGANVAICARGAEMLGNVRDELAALATQPGQKIVACPADVTREDDVRKFFGDALREFPGIDILVNCAGIAGPQGPFDQNSWAEWRQAIDININGTALPCWLAIPHMKKNGRGKIINLSGGGATKPTPHLSAYAASKAAVVRLTETLAVELRDSGIDVNAVAPGVLYTKVVEDFLKVDASVLGASYVEEVKRQKENGLPAFDRAAALCAWLASSASDGISGRLISAVWDPWENLAERRDELRSSDIYTLRRIVPEDRGKSWGGGEKTK
jgi:3-oxoacyl-[acyl-carrier protein] reductase